MRYLRQLKPNQLKNKTCLLRVDLNIQDADLRRINAELRRINFRVSQCPVCVNLRLMAILPTIKFLIKNGAKVVILSHRGRPAPLKREISNFQFPIPKQFSLKPFAKIISLLSGRPVHFINNFNFGDIENKVKKSRPGAIFILENLRFFPGEEKNDKDFAKLLASLGDIYVNDAFAVSHRANASVEAIAQFLPSYAGLLLEKELNNLDAVMRKFKKPLVIILGGAKVSDKIGLINNFLGKADYFLISGAMANTFFASQGLPVGESLYEPTAISFAVNLMTSDVIRFVLPRDVVIHQRKILDIGPETIKVFGKVIGKAKTIIWNGPMGMFEDEKFAKGTKEITAAVFRNKKARIVLGGGETIAALQAATQTCAERTQNYAEKFCVSQRQVRVSPRIFLSTGGGAMLEYLAGKKLPGVEVLKNNR